MSAPDFYMTSADLTGEWARLRSCWIEKRVEGPHHSQYAVVRIDPPGRPKHQATAVDRILVSPRYEGTTLFPRSDDPLAVYVYTADRPEALDRPSISSDDVRIEAWCELYSNRVAAEQVAAEA